MGEQGLSLSLLSQCIGGSYVTWRLLQREDPGACRWNRCCRVAKSLPPLCDRQVALMATPMQLNQFDGNGSLEAYPTCSKDAVMTRVCCNESVLQRTALSRPGHGMLRHCNSVLTVMAASLSQPGSALRARWQGGEGNYSSVLEKR
eukprot:1143208-Pelagomonas_calceolata.AAC.2